MKIVPQAPSQSKPDAFQEMIGQMQGFIRQAAEHRCAAHEVEQELFKQLLQLGLLLLKEFFARLGTGDEGEQVEVAGLGRLKRSPTLHSRRYQSIFGEVVLERWVYSRGQKRRVEYAAVDAQPACRRASSPICFRTGRRCWRWNAPLPRSEPSSIVCWGWNCRWPVWSR